PQAAETFADVLLRAAGRIHDEYFVEVARAELLEWAIRGLYDRLPKSLPPEIEERLRRIAGMKENELRDLLVDARNQAEGERTLSSEHYLDLALDAMTRNLDDQTRAIHRSPFRDFCPAWVPVGLGLDLRPDPATAWLEVATPVLNGPAYHAGIRA